MINNKNVDDIVRQYGSPLYLYEEDVILRQVIALKEALTGFSIYYSVKTNPNMHICRFMSNQGFGADTASSKEVVKALEAGFDKQDILRQERLRKTL